MFRTFKSLLVVPFLFTPCVLTVACRSQEPPAPAPDESPQTPEWKEDFHGVDAPAIPSVWRLVLRWDGEEMRLQSIARGRGSAQVPDLERHVALMRSGDLQLFEYIGRGTGGTEEGRGVFTLSLLTRVEHPDPDNPEALIGREFRTQSGTFLVKVPFDPTWNALEVFSCEADPDRPPALWTRHLVGVLPLEPGGVSR